MSAVTTITALMREDEATRTLLDLLTTEKMDGSDSTISTTTVTVTTTGAPPVPSTTPRSDGLQGRWSALKQRLGLKGIICCGSGWNHRSTSSSSAALLPADDEFDDADSPPQTPPAVNLATALAEERQLRQLTTAPYLESGIESSSAPVTPSKVSLMRLMAEAAMEAYEEDGGGGGGEEAGKSGRCCVCMERKKGAAFIPCGHTLCRVCSREIWVNRGHCPLCNRSIADVLDIF